MKKMECVNCGGPIENITDKYCSYCGSLIVNNKHDNTYKRESSGSCVSHIKVTTDDIYNFSDEEKKKKYPRG